MYFYIKRLLYELSSARQLFVTLFRLKVLVVSVTPTMHLNGVSVLVSLHILNPFRIEFNPIRNDRHNVGFLREDTVEF